MSWLVENGLALYGAITGTIALLISFVSHRHNIKKDQIKLAVSYSEHPNKTENIESLNCVNTEHPWNQQKFVEVYLVTVRNLGSISAPLQDVGVMDKEGRKYQALVRSPFNNMNFLQPLTKSNSEALEPKAAKTFPVYLNRGEPIFTAVSSYATDQTGKEWRGGWLNTIPYL